jgi:hypothetical protein
MIRQFGLEQTCEEVSMIDYKTEIVIERPVKDAFTMLKDVARYDEWTEMAGTRVLIGDGLTPGSQIETRISLGPVKQTLRFEVVALEEDRRLQWRTVSDAAMGWDAEFILTPLSADRTQIVSSGKIWLNGVLKISEPLIAGEVRSGEAKELQKFKELVERS